MTEEQPGIVTVVGDDGILRITIDRADVGNSLSPLARDALTAAILNAHVSPDVRSVLLTAAGSRHFCSGAGLGAHTGQGAPPERRPGDVAKMLKEGWQRLIAAVLDCDKPVVAAVQGSAAGAGTSLVLACDLVVMSSDARLVAPFVQRGILPDSGAIHLLTRIVGLRRATEILMLGEPIDAAGCERLGLVNRVTPPDATLAAAEEWALRLAQGPAVMLAHTKRLLAVSSESDRDQAFEGEAAAQEVVSRTADMQEGLRAFAERRPPNFTGR